jgi:phospholipase/carboxylesterase
VRVLVPTAPLMSHSGRFPGPSWYDYDGDQEHFRTALARAETSLMQLLQRIESEEQLAPRRRVLLGFSQGGYCGSWIALRNSDRFSGMVVSAARVKVEFLGDAIRRAGEGGFTALLCHGRNDRAVRLEAAESSRNALTTGGVQTTLHTFDSGHTMSLEQIETIRTWLVTHFRLE